MVSTIITDYTFVPENGNYHNQFRYRTKEGTEFTGLSEINTLELSKLPSDADQSDLWYWMKFIKSDDGEVLDMIAESNQQMRKTIGVLKELSDDECARMIYEDREKARRDMASMISAARREGRQEAITAFAWKRLKRIERLRKSWKTQV